MVSKNTCAKLFGLFCAAAVIVVIVVVVWYEETKSSSSVSSFLQSNSSSSSSASSVSPYTTPVFHLKASALANGTVTSWNDSSYSFVAEGANKPIAFNDTTIPAYVSFNASTNLYCSNVTLGQSTTYMVVAYLPSGAFAQPDNAFIWSSGVDGGYFLFGYFGGLVSINNGLNTAATTTLATSSYYIFFVVSNSTNSTIYHNAVNVASGAAAPTVPYFLGVSINGIPSDGDQFPWNAIEIAAWNSTLSLVEIQDRVAALTSTYSSVTFA